MTRPFAYEIEMNTTYFRSTNRTLIHINGAAKILRLLGAASMKSASALRFLVLFKVAIFIGQGVALADDHVAAGRALAERLCARCHAIGATDGSPLAKAPPFKTFKSKWPLSYLEEALAEGIVTGHEDMPQFTFSPDEIQQLLSHIESLPIQSE